MVDEHYQIEEGIGNLEQYIKYGKIINAVGNGANILIGAANAAGIVGYAYLSYDFLNAPSTTLSQEIMFGAISILCWATCLGISYQLVKDNIKDMNMAKELGIKYQAILQKLYEDRNKEAESLDNRANGDPDSSSMILK
jgi:hypothetical protein